MSDIFDLSDIYGTCPNCDTKRTSVSWCVDCDVEYLVGKFRNWSSGDLRIDNLIRNTQQTAMEYMGYLEWIDFSEFELVKSTGKDGSFSTIYSAVWLEGPLWKWDDGAETWIRSGPTKVMLKRLNNSSYLSDNFINQVGV
jgi:hypothetical protein